MTARFTVDRSYRRPNRGRVVVGGSPLRLFTLSERGLLIVDAVEAGQVMPSGHATLTDRLLDAGAIHPVVELEPCDSRLLTVIVPSRGDLPLFHARQCRAIAVDDGSTPALAVRDMELVRLDSNVGPGGARNAGLAMVTTPYVAFVDADVVVDEDDLLRLAAHLVADPTVALVAPRVGAVTDAGALARFEQRHSPLDMGGEPARIAPTTRVSYVPAAVLVCRTDAVREVGGFAPDLRYGEDVDLVWRLVAAGRRCRYEPQIIALHRTRSTLAAWLRQRYCYGTSAAVLAERHPGALAPVRMSPWSVATWLPVLAGVPLVGALVGAGTAVALTRTLRTIPASEALRLAGMGNLYAGRLLSATLTRAWWPITLVLAMMSSRVRRMLVLAVVVPAALDWRAERPPLDPVRYVALRLLDDVAYGAGVWAGALRARSFAAITPSLESWPPRSRT